MIKKLDKLIIKAFISPFFATFFISLFVLVMQFFWLYLDDLVGKGLDIFTIFKLIGYVAAYNVLLALPLALLLSSIMTFGNLGESFELVAIKSAGIPLIRFMRPLMIITIFLSLVAFVFSNNIIPVINLKLETLKFDIIVTKPAFDIKEGVFYDKIDGIVIKIGKKDDNDSTIYNVVIYEKSNTLQDRIMVAESGTMSVTPDKKFLQFNLYNGWRYEENGQRTSNTEFIRLGFSSYKKILDLSSFKMNKSADSLRKDQPRMLSSRQLLTSIDSLGKNNQHYYQRTYTEVAPHIAHLRYVDSNWNAYTKDASVQTVRHIDSIIGNSLQLSVEQNVLNHIESAENNIHMLLEDYKQHQSLYRKYWMEWHRKFTLSVACFVFFIIGAPLGAIIRKGGLGLPLVFAIVFFVIFHVVSSIGEKFAKEGVVFTAFGMWLSTLVLIPVGIFLTYKAMHDSTLFDKESYFRMFKNLKKGMTRMWKTSSSPKIKAENKNIF